ncbi:epoxide hydrolase [Rhodococcus enclensis]|nr:epoxide hydrolase [Rhodococcus erythropolis]MBT2270009.1 epoxide hydrolase [Rhodococcus qingshengii]
MEYWSDGYDWRNWERQLNSRPHFIHTVDGLDLHFWHVRGVSSGSIPIVLIHGWPSSAFDFWELLGPLTDPAAHGAADETSFDVIVIELPGFGFSGKPTEPGWGVTRTADAFHALVHDILGYDRYMVHGEDWGTVVGAGMARRHPESVTALQIAMPYVPPYGEFAPDPEWDARLHDLGGDSCVQNQIPDALTMGMVDSPLALTAWVLERFAAWSDNDGSVTSALSLDALVTNLHFYWVTSSIMSAARFYREAALEGAEASEHNATGAIGAPVIEAIGLPKLNVPTGVIALPSEPFLSPRPWIEGVYNLQRYSTFERGGHFAAFEEPDIVLSEIRAFFSDYVEQA